LEGSVLKKILPLLCLLLWGMALGAMADSSPWVEPTTAAKAAPDSSPPVDVPVPANLWDRIREGFAMPPLDDERRINRHIAWFSARPQYVQDTVERSRRYLYFIVEEVQKRNMPMEIALLPVVESAFNPHALSRSQASGMWQFIPSTGKLFGLEQNWWFDGRRDVIAATQGALDYLQQLYNEFGSWELALAGYNCGEGKIRREIAYNSARNLPTDYLSLRLPEETRNYVPRLLAAKAIVQDPEAYGLSLSVIDDKPYFSAVKTNKRIDTKVAAAFADMNMNDFLMLNPAFNRPVISLDFDQEKTILVPVDKADAFVTKLEDPSARLLSWRVHQLRKGERLDQVAKTFGMSPEELKRINGISKNKNVAGGGSILVPDHSGHGEDNLALNSKPEAELSPPPAPKKPARKSHHPGKAAHPVKAEKPAKPATKKPADRHPAADQKR
jgi:membrane-bound lytic murein transglycosylase D